MDKYEKSESKRKILEKIVVFNSYRVKDSLKESSVKQDIIQCLTKEKTMEFVFSIDGSRFYPIAIYRSRQYDREYYVTLQNIEPGIEDKDILLGDTSGFNHYGDSLSYSIASKQI